MNERLYKTLLGNRIYLIMDMPKYSIEVDETTKQKLAQEAAQKMNRAEVYDRGLGVHEDNPVKIGDKVLVGTGGISRGELITLSKDLVVMAVNPMEIMHIW